MGGTSGSLSSAGLQETIRTHGTPEAGSAGKLTTLSSTITSGRTSSMISCSRSSTYLAPSTSAWKVGAMNSPSCSIVGLRNTGAVSRMKSFQNWPGSSSVSGGGASRISRSSNPCASSAPGERLLDDEDDPVAAPRGARRRCPTQLFVGPYALSGKKAIVLMGAHGTWLPRWPARATAVEQVYERRRTRTPIV